MKTTFISRALIVGLMLVAGVCRAGNITYQVDQTGIGFDNGSVTGTIETDGTIGTLAASDIITWNLQAACLGFVGCSADNFNLTGGAGGNSSVSITGNGLTATATDLLFNYVSGGVFEIVDSPNGWELGFTSGPVFEEILPLGLGGNAVPETGTQIVGTATPEPSTFSLVLIGLLGLMRKRLAR